MRIRFRGARKGPNTGCRQGRRTGWKRQTHAKTLRRQDELKLKGLKLGFLLNFGAHLMKDGIERVVNGLEESLGVFASLRETRIEAEPGSQIINRKS